MDIKIYHKKLQKKQHWERKLTIEVYEQFFDKN